jgi:hypothetical protein
VLFHVFDKSVGHAFPTLQSFHFIALLQLSGNLKSHSNREIYKQTMGEGLTVHGRKNPDALDEIEKLTTEIMEILNNEI